MAQPQASPKSELPVNVLVVDDKVENRIALRAVLSRPGYKIVEAASSGEALKELLTRDFAVLLLDVVMPDTDGFELAELVRARDATYLTPILFVTGQAGDVDRIAQGYKVGAVDYLVKPLVPDIVRAKVAVFAQLYRQRRQIEAALREKQILLREIHHRVKNNLQIISSLLHLQAAMQSAEVRALFMESDARVRSIALVHERLHLEENVATIDVPEYVASLADGLRSAYGMSRIDMKIECDEIALPMDTAIPCGLIINELVSNALKHAYAGDRTGTITVKFREEPAGQLVLEVKDDGIGLPPGVDVEHASRTGLQLVHTLASQLEGVVAVERDPGTKVTLRFPKPAEVIPATAAA